MRNLVACDIELTKDCFRIIAENRAFFESIKGTKQVITIGHSLSKVDWPYFAEIVSDLTDKDNVRWYFGCHSLRDIENLKTLSTEFGIEQNAITVFRTDVVRVNLKRKAVATPVHAPKAKYRCQSSDGKWLVQTLNRNIEIVENSSDVIQYEVEFPANIFSLFFLPGGKRLILISNDYPSGIFVFEFKNNKWSFSFKFEKNADNNFLTKSLNRILLIGDRLVFIYNNRVREHSMLDGSLIKTSHIKGARNRQYPGEDVTVLFKRNRR